MLAPLAVGKHTLHFGGRVVIRAGESIGPLVFPDVNFIEDITYHLTVAPGKTATFVWTFARSALQALRACCAGTASS